MTSLMSAFLKVPCFINRQLSKGILNRAIKKRRAYSCGERQKLLYVAASCLPYHISGYTARTHEILKSLQSHGYDAHALTRPGYPWDRRDRLADPADSVTTHDGIRYRHFRHPTNSRQVADYALSGARQIEEYAITNKVTRIHAASNHVNALPALVAARHLGLPFQYEIRGLWELTRASRFPAYYNSPPFRMGLELEKYVASHADRIFVISRQLGLYISHHWNIEPERISLLPNCVDMARVHPDPDVEVEQDLIGYAGSLISYEGLDVLLEALAILRSKGKVVKLLVIGEGEARADLENMAQKLGLGQQACFTGRLNPATARKRLSRAAMICLPRKNFEVCKIVTPLKLVEAMAMGKALITPDLPVFKDEIGELASGWTFKANDAEDLARLIGENMTQYAKVKVQGQLLCEHVKHTRQWDHFICDLMDS